MYTSADDSSCVRACVRAVWFCCYLLGTGHFYLAVLTIATVGKAARPPASSWIKSLATGIYVAVLR